MFAMGYNGREVLESSYRLGASSNGLGSEEGLSVSMSTLSVSPGASAALHTSSQSPSPSSLSRSTSTASARTNLNPNAAEFVPGSLKPAVVEGAGSRLDRTNSSNSNASDDEYRRFCRAQLPDDLMPEFDLGDFVESGAGPEYEEGVDAVSAGSGHWSGGNAVVPGDHFLYADRVNPSASVRASPYSPRYGVGAEGSTSTGFVRPYMPELRGSAATRQQQQQLVQSGWSESTESVAGFSEWGGSDLTFPEDLTEVVDPVTVLATEFPGFSSESLAEIYYANGGDLGQTIDMLSELELQNEGASVRPFQQPAAPAPPSSRDFPALAGIENVSRSPLSGRASLGEARSVPDFAAAVRKQAAQQAAQLQFERNGGVDLSLRGLSPGPGLGGYLREARVAQSDRVDPFQLHGHDVQAPTAWLETGESVANMYADMREEARDHARVRNAYFDQARQAYLTGNKALAKELSAKGQWHNEQMKAAHSKAGEAIFWQRNSNGFVNNSSAPGQPHLIDLHGLHVGEAIPLLKREIAQLRYNVRSTRQRAHVFICVGTGHHTKGSRTPSRLPAAVQRYLLEEEHLQFTEPQAGMLRIILR